MENNNAISQTKPKSSHWYSLLWNPFPGYSQNKTIILGVLVLVIGSVSAVVGNVRYPGVFTWQYVESVPWMAGFLDQLISLMVTFAVFVVAALISGSERIRYFKLAGSIMLARAPIVILPFLNFNGWLWEASEQLVDLNIEGNDLPEFIASIVLVLVSIVLIVFMVWTLSLLFNAYRSSTKMSGVGSLISFVLAMIGSLIISAILIPESYF